MRTPRLTLLLFMLLVFAVAPGARADGPLDGWELRTALVLPRVGRFGRTPFPQDPILAALAAGTFQPPRIGTAVIGIDGETATWEAAEADAGGWFSGPALRGGYVLWTVDAPAPTTMILEASGHSAVYVGGVWRAGDPYQNNWLRLPVRLEAGRNQLLFHVSRGRVRAKLVPPPADVFFSLREPTLPDLVRGEPWAARGAVVVVNATPHRQEGLVIRAAGAGVPVHETAIDPIEPMTFRKVPFWLGGAAAPDLTQVPFDLTLARAGRVYDDAAVTLRVRAPHERHRRTFLSEIDGSVQYYAVTPRDPAAPPPDRPAVYYTLHGASVEALRQASVYRPKPDGPVIAPTNRRPFGFDWEDWGRLDALEVMKLTIDQADPGRVYLTGHSMGGHGTWHLGVTFPGMFAAIGPSAGWRSFWSYTGAERFEDATPIEALLRRATNPSDTVQLTRNLLGRGVYILHGDKDDNVPVEQARFMREHLQAFHPDLAYHEQPGAGHWWGDQCCDWSPMFEFFSTRSRPPLDRIDHVEFHTANPGVSASCDWIIIEQQRAMLAFSSVVADRAGDEVVIVTENVASLRLDPAGFADWPDRVTIDGRALSPPGDATHLRLVRDDDAGWSVVTDPLSPEQKGPHRAGPFKDAFRHRVQFVYGTRGTSAENRWAADRARADAEIFWYRGNGALEVLPDTQFDANRERDRSVVLYGNRATNAAWEPLLAESPVQVDRDVVLVGDDRLTGGDLACLFLRPRPGSAIASVAVIGGTGPHGMHLTDRLPYFVSGVAYPDLLVFRSSVLEIGAGGVERVGFFGLDWSVGAGEFRWSDP